MSSIHNEKEYQEYLDEKDSKEVVVLPPEVAKILSAVPKKFNNLPLFIWMPDKDRFRIEYSRRYSSPILVSDGETLIEAAKLLVSRYKKVSDLT